MADAIISLNNVTKSFPGVRALNGVSFDIARGELHCIVGENGAGKSTLIKLLAGVHQYDSGEILLDGHRVNFRNPKEAKAAGVGVVYQELSNFVHLSVASNLYADGFPTRGGRIDYRALHRGARERLDDCGLHQIDERALMKDISLGAQQMVEIAALVSGNARVVILDEPTSALTEVEVAKLYELIDRMKSQGITIIYISHRLDEVIRLADTITVLKDGEHVITFPKAPDTDKHDLVRYMVGREVAYDYKVGTSEIGEVILETQNLSSGGALRDVSITLRRGEILGIAGLEGSGRTELLETLFGWRAATGGQVLLHGKPARLRDPIDAKRSRMAYITKDRKLLGLFLGLDIQSNIAAASSKNYVAGGLIRYGKIEDNAGHYADAVQIKCSSLNQKVLNLSGGNQQKVLLSMWLSTDPDILMIDEPTRGVDVGAKAEIHALLRQSVSEGRAVIMVSSELPEVIASCDRVVVMHEGSVTGILENKNLSEEELMRLASGLQAG